MAKKRKAKNPPAKMRVKMRHIEDGAVSRFDIVEVKRQCGFDLAREIELLSNKFKVQINGNLTIKDFPKQEANRTAQGYSRTADRDVYVVGCGYSAA